MSKASLGYCSECKAQVPAEYVVRDNFVWFRKSCPECGDNDAPISSDPETWQAKRDLWEGDPGRNSVNCKLNCDKCKIDHATTTLFLDVTNRCNMDCPMCGFSLRGMGFEFNPPLEYFDKVLEAVSQMRPRPVVNLFGGEPTVRNDMFEILKLGRKYKVEIQITTNALRLADEEYCKQVCKAHVGLRIGFDARSREVYERLRNNGQAYEKKLKALENIKKYTRRKHTIFATAAMGITDPYMEDLIQYCHDNRDFISDLGVLPLYENWKPGEFEVDSHTTPEDVEKLIQESVPGGGVDFIPAGMTYWLGVMRPFFSKKPDSGLLNFAGIHPNCESVTFLVSDGESYRGLNHYLNKPLTEAAEDLAAAVKKIQPKLAKLDPAKPLQRLRGKLLCATAMAPWALRTVNKRRLAGPNPINRLGKALWSQWKRRRTKRRTKKSSPSSYLRVVIIPLEEQHAVDSERLKRCRVGSVYEDAKTGTVEVVPHCVWFPYRNPILQEINKKYGTTRDKKKVVPLPLRKAA